MLFKFNTTDGSKTLGVAPLKKRNIVKAWYLGVLYALIVGLSLAGAQLGMFHYIENLAICFALACPVAYLATYALPLASWYARYRQAAGNTAPITEAKNLQLADTENLYEAMTAGDAMSGQPAQEAAPVGIMFRLVSAALISAALAGVMMVLNNDLDKSAAKEITLPVQDKYVGHGKHGRTYYRFLIASPVPSPLPVSISDTESFNVSHSTYEGIMPGKTQATIEMHAGYFGMPWHEKGYSLASMAKPAPRSNTAATSQQVTAQFANNAVWPTPVPAAVVKEACGWASNFDFNRDIGTQKPDYERQRDNNGMKAIEPILGGRIHGLAKYWYPNGNYAEVTYLHGKVHGYFKVYASNGTLTLNSAYKNGDRFGITVRQAADGSHRQEMVIINNMGQPVTVCH